MAELEIVESRLRPRCVTHNVVKENLVGINEVVSVAKPLAG